MYSGKKTFRFRPFFCACLFVTIAILSQNFGTA